MPRLLLFAPCERAILADDNTVSLITILETLRLNFETKEEIPPDLAIPFAWHAISLWTRETEDKDGTFYHQKIQLLMPDGTTPIELEIPLQFGPGKTNTRGIFKVMGFPIPKASALARVRLLVRPVNSTTEWSEVSAFPIYLEVPV